MDLSQPQILITGCAGFNGSYLAQDLFEEKKNVLIEDDENNVTTANREVIRREIERVYEIVNVNVFLDGLPSRCELHRGDYTVRLSGDQCQGVAFPSALSEDNDFLLLYESKNELDSNLKREVQDGIEPMADNYWILAIAHRLSTVKNAGPIHIINSGKMIESGTHRKLLEYNRDYTELHPIQSSA